jgi:dihydroorotate dehydrogenase
VIATNTTIGRKDLRTPEPRIAEIGAGGLSGAPLRARALEGVEKARAALGPDAVVIGVGGIETAAHARALLTAGADLVQLYTGFIYEGPGLPRRLARELRDVSPSRRSRTTPGAPGP